MKKKIKPIIMPTTGTKYFPMQIVEDRIKNLPFRPWEKQRIKENAVFVPPGITYEKAIKNIEEKVAANKKLYKSSGRGQWNKKAVEIMNKCMENNSEQQIIIKNASKKLTKEILKTGIGKQVQIKEHAPLGNVPIALMIPKDHLKKCTNILIDGMIKEGAKKMRNLVRVTNYKTGCSFTPKKNYNAKKLKAKHKDLWLAIGKAVALDITDQQSIINSKKNNDVRVGHIPMLFIENVAENAAFIAIVEMIKRGLL